MDANEEREYSHDEFDMDDTGQHFITVESIDPRFLERLLFRRAPGSRLNRVLPSLPPPSPSGHSIIYFVDLDNLPDGDDLGYDKLSPWTSPQSKPRSSLFVCEVDRDGYCLKSESGADTVRHSQYSHPRILGLDRSLIRPVVGRKSRGIGIVAYSFKKPNIILDVIDSKNRLLPSERKRIREASLNGQRPRQVLAANEGLLPQQVHDQRRDLAVAKSNTGPCRGVNWNRLHLWSEANSHVREIHDGGAGNRCVFLQSSFMQQVFNSSLLNSERIDEIVERSGAWNKADISSLQFQEEAAVPNLAGVAFLDVTFGVCEGYFLSIFGVISPIFKVRATGNHLLMPAGMMLSDRHDSAAMARFGDFLQRSISGKKFIRCLVADQERSFNGVMKAAFCDFASRIDCTTHLASNMERVKIERTERNRVTEMLFGNIDGNGVVCGGALNAGSEEEYNEIIDAMENENYSEEAVKWVRDRKIRIWRSLNLRERMRAGLGCSLPSSNLIENYNSILQNSIPKKRRPLDETVQCMIKEMDVLTGLGISALRDGGTWLIDKKDGRSNSTILQDNNIVLDDATLIVSELPTSLWPVPAGPARRALDRQIQSWKLKVMGSTVYMKNEKGEFGGVEALPSGALTCGSNECRRPRAPLCSHRLAVLASGDFPESVRFYTKKEESLSSLVPTKGGEKPSLRPSVPRKGGHRPEITGIRKRTSSCPPTVELSPSAESFGISQADLSRIEEFDEDDCRSPERSALTRSAAAPLKRKASVTAELARPVKLQKVEATLSNPESCIYDVVDLCVQAVASDHLSEPIARSVPIVLDVPNEEWRRNARKKFNVREGDELYHPPARIHFEPEMVPTQWITSKGLENDSLFNSLAALISSECNGGLYIRIELMAELARSDALAILHPSEDMIQYTRDRDTYGTEIDGDIETLAFAEMTAARLMIYDFQERAWLQFTPISDSAAPLQPLFLVRFGRAYHAVTDMEIPEFVQQEEEQDDDTLFSLTPRPVKQTPPALHQSLSSPLQQQKTTSSTPKCGLQDSCEIVLISEAIRARNRKCTGCKLNLIVDSTNICVSHKLTKNSKLYHIECFKDRFRLKCFEDFTMDERVRNRLSTSQHALIASHFK